MSRHHLVPGSLVVVACLGLAACSPSPAPTGSPTPGQSVSGAAGSSQAPSGTPSLPEMAAPTEACDAVDGVLVEALDQTTEGQTFTALGDQASSQETQTAWESFAQALSSRYHAQLVTAAGDDTTATDAVDALDTYASTSAKLSGGEVPEFVDEQQAREDLNAGRTPEANPEYQEATRTLTDAHVTLSQCLPHWPIIF